MRDWGQTSYLPLEVTDRAPHPPTIPKTVLSLSAVQQLLQTYKQRIESVQHGYQTATVNNVASSNAFEKPTLPASTRLAASDSPPTTASFETTSGSMSASRATSQPAQQNQE